MYYCNQMSHKIPKDICINFRFYLYDLSDLALSIGARFYYLDLDELAIEAVRTIVDCIF